MIDDWIFCNDLKFMKDFIFWEFFYYIWDWVYVYEIGVSVRWLWLNDIFCKKVFMNLIFIWSLWNIYGFDIK